MTPLRAARALFPASFFELHGTRPLHVHDEHVPTPDDSTGAHAVVDVKPRDTLALANFFVQRMAPFRLGEDAIKSSVVAGSRNNGGPRRQPR